MSELFVRTFKRSDSARLGVKLSFLRSLNYAVSVSIYILTCRYNILRPVVVLRVSKKAKRAKSKRKKKEKI